MKKSRLELGALGEEAASQYIRRRGYRILERNYRNRTGEIDIIAQDGQVIVFIEVKTRSSDEYGLPVDAVTKTKQSRLIRSASYYLKRRSAPLECRFDVVSIIMGQNNKPRKIELIKDAFSVSA